MKTANSKILTALIVDDERLARKELISMLSDFDQIKVTGEADGYDQAKDNILKTEPEVIFLDIQMPGKSGFDLINEVDINAKIVFVTAFDEYAIRAFEVNAMDYLLKPVSPDRLAQCIDRLFNDSIPVKILTRKLNFNDRLFIEIGNKIRFLKIKEIVSIHADGDYTTVKLSNGNKGLVTKPMKEWELRLPEKYFCRIHRSSIINLEFIDRIEKYFNNSYKIFVKGEKDALIISRRYAKKIKDIFG